MSEKNAFEAMITGESEAQSRKQRWKETFDLWVVAPVRIMWDDRRTRYGTLIILLYLFAGTAGVWLLDAPALNEGPAHLGAFENWEFPLGTNDLGQDMLSATVHATPAMLKMMAAGGLVATFVGTLVGTIAGYKRGPVEKILMTLTDIAMTIPGLPLLIVLAVALEPRDPFTVGIILSITAWAGLARSLHSQVLSLRNESYVEASHVMGLSSMSVIRDDILPNIMPYVMINFMGNTTRVIHASVGLYFLGVLPFTTSNWGVMLNRAYYGGALYSWDTINWLGAPILAITLISYGVVLFSQGMDRLFNPRVRARTVSDDESVPDHD